MLYEVDDFRILNQYAVGRIAKLLNERPRQTLGYKTPKEALAELRLAFPAASYKDLKAICSDLKAIYTAASDAAGRAALEDFGSKWNARYPMIYRSWSTRREDLNEFFNYPPEIRKAIYTTNAIESLNFHLRKVTKNRASFPNDDVILKIMYLAIRNASTKWTMPLRDWL